MSPEAHLLNVWFPGSIDSLYYGEMLEYSKGEPK